MEIQENISLRPYNTFGVDVKARQFAVFYDSDQLNRLVTQAGSTQVLVLGGGSNILFTKDFPGLVVVNGISGMEVVTENDHHVLVRVGGGMPWHHFVTSCVQRDWGGVENLSLIPGSVGASPIQNIGAYGVELREVFFELNAYHIRERRVYSFSLNDCRFGYRESVFKNGLKNQYVILNVTFRLSKVPSYNTSYAGITEELGRMGVKSLSIQSISQAVTNIRRSKLPDPAKVGNAGSFFKNPIIGKDNFNQLSQNFPGLPGRESPDGSVKLPAAWMIEQCGWKGYRRGDAGCDSTQALVLVNYGNASGEEISALADQIAASVLDKFGVVLETEVNVI